MLTVASPGVAELAIMFLVTSGKLFHLPPPRCRRRYNEQLPQSQCMCM